MRFPWVILAFISCLVVSCARGPIKTPNEAMRISKTRSTLVDDLDFLSLVAALEANVKQLRTPGVKSELNFGPRQIPSETYARSLEFLLGKAKEDPSGETFKRTLDANFEHYEVYGQKDWGQVFITSYFEPVIEGALKRSGRFTQAIYAVPRDLVVIDLKTFANVPPGLEQRSRDSILRGRLLATNGKDEMPRVVAFPDRAQFEIESGPRSEVLAWADPVDVFFLEIQGSGVVKLKDGKEIRLGYAAQNGHPYVPIGRFLKDVIPKDKITMHSIENHLRQVGPEEARRIMNLNPSYVFFRKLQTAGITYFGSEVVAGRTIATDQSFFPKGALAFLEFEKPKFTSAADRDPAAWEKASRFVIDQDTGGAIRGPHRVDLFWGRGAEAKQAAGVIKGKGRLVYFVPREGFLRTL
jgi:membrane-bound lytic murein transglycosylase A